MAVRNQKQLRFREFNRRPLLLEPYPRPLAQFTSVDLPKPAVPPRPPLRTPQPIRKKEFSQELTRSSSLSDTTYSLLEPPGRRGFFPYNEVGCRPARPVKSRICLFGTYCLLLLLWLVAGTLTFNHFESVPASAGDPGQLLKNISLENIASVNDFMARYGRQISISNISVSLVQHDFGAGSVYYRQVMTIYYRNSSAAGPRDTWDLTESFLFCVALLSTVGYGAQMAPKTAPAKICCVIFAVVGMPLFVAVVAEIRRIIVAMCQRVTERRNLGGPSRNQRDFRTETLALIFTVSLTATATALAGSAVLFWWVEDDWSFEEALYFGFISLSTIGFGDLLPGRKSESLAKFPGPWAVCLYRLFVSVWLFFGLIFMTTLFGSIHEVLSRQILRAHCYWRISRQSRFRDDIRRPDSTANFYRDDGVVVVVNRKP